MSENSSETQRPILKKSALPIYAVGAIWVAGAFVAPCTSFFRFAATCVLSIVAYVILDKLIPTKTIYAKKVEKYSGNEAADEVIRLGRGYLADIQKAVDLIDNKAVIEKIMTLDGICQNIFDFVIKKPSSVSKIRRFVNYYLPNLKKLSETYCMLEKQSFKGENITASMKNIEKMLDTMKDVFLKTLDSLFADTAMDVEADISVMEQMMHNEGI